MTAGAALLLLADGRLPAGGHAHSGGLEPAVTDGSVRSLDDLAAFLAGRLATTGRVAAAFAAATCALDRAAAGWADAVRELDVELDARTPSPAQRAASRAQGRALLRAGRAAWPELACPVRTPHHPVALGLAAAAAGQTPADAATVAAYAAVTGPAAAATRLLGLDPLAVTALLARLAPAIDEVAAQEAAAGRPARDLPSTAAVRLDLLAEAHRAADVRLFAS